MAKIGTSGGVEVTPGKIVLWVFLGVFAVVFLFGLFSIPYRIDSGQRGVILTWGRADMVSVQPGLHGKWPFAQEVVKFSVQTQNYGADASSSTYESASSKDLQVVKVAVAINYHVDEESVPTIFSEVGSNYEDKIITPLVHESVKAVTAQYTAEELITDREEVRAKIQDLLKTKLAPYHIIVEQVSITKFDFSEQFNAAIEAKVTAEQQALTQKNKLAQVEYEAQQRVAQATGERDALIAQAQGQANATLLNAQAEAEKIRLQNQELAKSPEYVELIKWQHWNGALPQYYITMSGATPLFTMPTSNLTR